jgi:hypothetical protein
VQSLGRVQEGARDAQALHAGDRLLSHEPALAHAADEQLAARVLDALDAFDSLQEAVPRSGVGLIQDGDLGERGRGGGEDVDGARQKTGAFRVVDGYGRRKGLGTSASSLHGRRLRLGHVKGQFHGVYRTKTQMQNSPPKM